MVGVTTGRAPYYGHLQVIIRDRIRSGEWAPGSFIQSERELCERYGINWTTARQTINGPESEGQLYRILEPSLLDLGAFAERRAPFLLYSE